MLKIMLGPMLPKEKSVGDRLADGASIECGLAGAMPLREYPLPRQKHYPARNPDKGEHDDDY